MARRYCEGVLGNLCSDCRMFFSRMHSARYRPLHTTSKSSTVTCRGGGAEGNHTAGTQVCPRNTPWCTQVEGDFGHGKINVKNWFGLEGIVNLILF